MAAAAPVAEVAGQAEGPTTEPPRQTPPVTPTVPGRENERREVLPDGSEQITFQRGETSYTIVKLPDGRTVRRETRPVGEGGRRTERTVSQGGEILTRQTIDSEGGTTRTVEQPVPGGAGTPDSAGSGAEQAAAPAISSAPPTPPGSATGTTAAAAGTVVPQEPRTAAKQTPPATPAVEGRENERCEVLPDGSERITFQRGKTSFTVVKMPDGRTVRRETRPVGEDGRRTERTVSHDGEIVGRRTIERDGENTTSVDQRVVGDTVRSTSSSAGPGGVRRVTQVVTPESLTYADEIRPRGGTVRRSTVRSDAGGTRYSEVVRDGGQRVASTESVTGDGGRLRTFVTGTGKDRREVVIAGTAEEVEKARAAGLAVVPPDAPRDRPYALDTPDGPVLVPAAFLSPTDDGDGAGGDAGEQPRRRQDRPAAQVGDSRRGAPGALKVLGGLAAGKLIDGEAGDLASAAVPGVLDLAFGRGDGLRAAGGAVAGKVAGDLARDVFKGAPGTGGLADGVGSIAGSLVSGRPVDWKGVARNAATKGAAELGREAFGSAAGAGIAGGVAGLAFDALDGGGVDVGNAVATGLGIGFGTPAFGIAYTLFKTLMATDKPLPPDEVLERKLNDTAHLAKVPLADLASKVGTGRRLTDRDPATELELRKWIPGWTFDTRPEVKRAYEELAARTGTGERTSREGRRIEDYQLAAESLAPGEARYVLPEERERYQRFLREAALLEDRKANGTTEADRRRLVGLAEQVLGVDVDGSEPDVDDSRTGGRRGVRSPERLDPGRIPTMSRDELVTLIRHEDTSPDVRKRARVQLSRLMPVEKAQAVLSVFGQDVLDDRERNAEPWERRRTPDGERAEPATWTNPLQEAITAPRGLSAAEAGDLVVVRDRQGRLKAVDEDRLDDDRHSGRYEQVRGGEFYAGMLGTIAEVPHDERPLVDIDGQDWENELYPKYLQGNLIHDSDPSRSAYERLDAAQNRARVDAVEAIQQLNDQRAAAGQAPLTGQEISRTLDVSTAGMPDPDDYAPPSPITNEMIEARMGAPDQLDAITTALAQIGTTLYLGESARARPPVATTTPVPDLDALVAAVSSTPGGSAGDGGQAGFRPGLSGPDGAQPADPAPRAVADPDPAAGAAPGADTPDPFGLTGPQTTTDLDGLRLGGDASARVPQRTVSDLSAPTAPVSGASGAAPRVPSLVVGSDTDLSRLRPHPQQVGLVDYLDTPEGAERMSVLRGSRFQIDSDEDWLRAVATTGSRLRDVMTGAPAVTPERAEQLYPSVEEEDDETDPMIREITRSDYTNEQMRDGLVGDPGGFASPEMSCWLVCDGQGRARVLDQVQIGTTDAVSPNVSALTRDVLAGASRAELVHMHPFSGHEVTGLSEGDLRGILAARSLAGEVVALPGYEYPPIPVQPLSAEFGITAVDALTGTAVRGVPDHGTRRWQSLQVLPGRSGLVTDMLNLERDELVPTESSEIGLPLPVEVSPTGTSNAIYGPAWRIMQPTADDLAAVERHRADLADFDARLGITPDGSVPDAGAAGADDGPDGRGGGDAPAAPGPSGSAGRERPSSLFVTPDQRIETLTGWGERAGVLDYLQGPGRDRLDRLVRSEYPARSDDDRRAALTDVANQLRDINLRAEPVTPQRAAEMFPVDPVGGGLSNLDRAIAEAGNAAQIDARRTATERSGLQCEIACWLVERDGRIRVEGGIGIGTATTVGLRAERALDRNTIGQADRVTLVHSHPFVAEESAGGELRSWLTAGLSPGDIRFVRGLGDWLGRNGSSAEAGTASIDCLTGCITSSALDRGSGAIRYELLPGPSGLIPDELNMGTWRSVRESPEFRLPAGGRIEEPGSIEELYDAVNEQLRPSPSWRRTMEQSAAQLADFDRRLASRDAADVVDAGDGLDVMDVIDSDNPVFSVFDAPPGDDLFPQAPGEPARATNPAGGVTVRPEPGLSVGEQADLGLIRLPGTWADQPVAPRADLGEPGRRDPAVDELLDPNTTGDAPTVPEGATGTETFPLPPQQDPREGVFTFPPLPEDGAIDLGPSTVVGGAVEARPAPQPGATRTGRDGRLQTYVGGQDLVGDGAAGTTPGRVNFYRAEDGTTEAVVISPRRANADGTETVWIPNLGTSVASNPGAEQVTSVQRVGSAEFAPGTTTQAIRIRTGEYTQPLAGGGDGSTAGSLTYRPVAGNPRLQDVIVRPSVTETENADGSRTVTYSAPVPVTRSLNARGATERFRVEVGTPMRQVSRTVLVPAPSPRVQVPSAAGSPSPAFGGNPYAHQRRGVTAGDAASDPERAANRNPAPAPRPAPSTSPVPRPVLPPVAEPVPLRPSIPNPLPAIRDIWRVWRLLNSSVPEPAEQQVASATGAGEAPSGQGSRA